MLQRLSRKTLVSLTVVANIIYIIWRLFFTIPSGTGWLSLFFAIGLLVVELIGMGEMFVHFYGMTNIHVPALPKIDEDLYPDVDVFIATYNEPIELVQKTISGCVHMLYPVQSKVHIYVCDDGSRPDMAALCAKMGVGYFVREEHKHAKAGNLNNALCQTSSPLVVTFDADMIPRHEFLLKTVPYFLKNEQAIKDGRQPEFPYIGFVQTPQCFYNTDLFQFNLHAEDRIPNEQDYFYRDIQTAKNATNSVIYGGSNTVILRQAIEAVGGFYTNSITENFATGMLIQNAGYQCYALDTALASGLAPDDLKALIKQRERWGRGCIQTGRRLNFLFLKGLSVGQKISYLSSITYWYSSVKRFFYITTPIMAAVFGVLAVDCTLLQVLCFWLPMYLLTNASIKKFSNNIRNTRWTNIYETILFRSLMIPMLLETVGIAQNTFAVTRKDKVKGTDRAYRIKQAAPFILYIALSLVGIFNMLRMTFLTSSASYFVTMFWLVSNLYALSMAAFFLLGREQLRKTDRFAAEVDCTLCQGTLRMQCRTIDISEQGFALFHEMPEYIDPAQPFTLTFLMETDRVRYQASMRGRLVQVQAVQGGWKYAGYISDITEENREIWNNIVHDRLPTLPQTIEGALGFYGDLEVNIRRRYAKYTALARKTARIEIEQRYPLQSCGEVLVKQFNYHYVTAQFADAKAAVPQMELPLLDGCVLRCVRAEKQFDETEILYEVENLAQLMADEALRVRLTKALLAFEQDVQQKQVTPNADDGSDALNLLEFV